MEHGFILPKPAVKKLAWAPVPGFIIGSLASYYFLKLDMNEYLGIWGFIALAFFVLIWFVSQRKYVYLSDAGIRGRDTTNLVWKNIAWTEQLTSKPILYGAQKAYRFTASPSGQSIFIPTSILQSPEFQSFVASHAPPNHPFRDFGSTSFIQPA
ncbi:MAG: hypothetical protein LBG66_06350 [Gallionellaceae bacterium]|jgi:hypothetical protein|nr:hypothetical protein [Gallionellaceae bacterium]